MKVLVLSMDCVGEGLAFALRCVKAGHQVRLHLAKTANPTIGDGFKGIEKVDSWITSVRWADLIVPTGNHAYLPALDRARAVTHVFGPSVKSATLEIDRAAGMKFFTEHGIEVPPFKTFKSLKDAEAHVRKTEARYVFKTMGDEDDKSLSYCSKSPADMVARLQRWQKLGMRLTGACMLQEFIEGTEFAVSGWMGKEGLLSHFEENSEHKKLLSGNVGPNCGEAGTMLKYVPQSKLADDVLRPLERALLALGGTGSMDVNCIIDKAGKAWPLEWTMRCGWPAFNIAAALHKGDPAQWMLDACEGRDALEVSPLIACGVVLAQPDYPHSNFTKAETDGIPIYGVTRANREYIWPQSVKRQMMPAMVEGKIGEAETWVSAGDYLAVITGTGRSVREACKRAYETLGELHVPDGMYRDDIGEKLEDELSELQKHGFATEWRY